MPSHLSRIAAFAWVSLLSISASAVAQELVVTTVRDYSYSGATGDPVVVIGDLASGGPGGALNGYATPPSSLSLDAVTGVLGGVPTSAGRYFFNVLVSGGAANAGRSCQLTILSDRIFADDFELP